MKRSAYINYERATRDVPYNILENIGNLFGCDPFVLYEDNAQINNKILSITFNIPDIDEKELKEIINFKDIVESYLKMERITQKKKSNKFGHNSLCDDLFIECITLN